MYRHGASQVSTKKRDMARGIGSIFASLSSKKLDGMQLPESNPHLACVATDG